MPIIALLILVIVVILVGGAYNIGLANGRELGKEEEAKRYKDEVKTEIKEVVVD